MDRRLQFIADRRDRVRFGLHFRQKILRLKNSNHNKSKSTNHPPVPRELFLELPFFKNCR
jgi:hypothetical protein